MDYSFGYPTNQRKAEIKEAVANSKENYQINYQGKYRPIPVIEVRIELPVYRMENIRTKSKQKEWIAMFVQQRGNLVFQKSRIES